ncbi:MAG: polysaccharide biosynthesis C-terminal domain-containing protein, partial [Clostridia bacterium]|nr:polysaccharide biosynthesis C-terminal domain-containing protein [Clostridia bacterium]
MRRALSPRHIDMCEGPILKNIIPYAIPLILSGVLQLLFNAADMVVVGRFCGSTSVGAVGATGSLINLLVNMFMGLSTGSGVAVAMSIGRGDREETHRTVHTAMLLACISGAAITVLGVVLTKPLLVLMETPADVLELAVLYVRIYFLGSIPNALYNFGAAIMRANGDTRRPMLYLIIAGVANVVLNILFVTLVKLDVAGVALATALSQLLSAVLVIHALAAQPDATRLDFTRLRMYGKEVKNILKIGIPAALQGCTFSISNMLIQSSINGFGTA